MNRDTELHILNILRQGTITWSGRSECLRRARKKVEEGKTKDGKTRFKFHWQCNVCKHWFRDCGMIEVDHIEEVGEFKGSFDLYIPRLYCEQENLQAICVVCHKKKTAVFNSRDRWVRKNA